MAYENNMSRNRSTSQHRKRRRKKKTYIFRKALLGYVAVLAILCIAALLYVRSSLVAYENSQPDVYMQNLVADLSGDSEVASTLEDKYFSSVTLSKFDDIEAFKQQFTSKITDAEITYAANPQSYDTSAPAYDLYSNGEVFMTVTLRSTNPSTRLGIMTISDWEIQSVAFSADDSTTTVQGGAYEYTISVPSMYSVFVNDIQLGEEELTGETTAITQFQYAAEYVEMPQLVTYHIEGLFFEPVITVTDSAGQNVEFTENNGSIVVEPAFTENSSADEISADISPLDTAKTWSRLMTDDLDGANHGLAQVKTFLIPGSYLDEMATDYAGSVDITFVSAHTLNSFTGESVSNYIKYNDNCFSCDVYFEKNMYLTRTGEYRTDVFNSRMFFVRIEDESVATPGWYLVDMQAIIEE